MVGLGRGWGRGSGVVIAEGRVLTNAHVLRGDEVAVRRGDGEVALGRVAGADAELDVAVIAVDTGDAPAVAWEPASVERSRAGQPVFALADPGGRGLRTTFGLVTATGRSLPRPARPPHRRLDRALGAAPARLVRRPARRRATGRLLGINTVRMEGGLLLALPADAALRARVDGARPRRGAGRVRGSALALAPPRAARRMRAAVGLPERDGLLVRGVEPGSPAAARRAASAATCSSPRAAGRSPASTSSSTRSTAPPATLALTVVRGTEEREVTAHFS